MATAVVAFAISGAWAWFAPHTWFAGVVVDEGDGDLKTHRGSIPPIGGIGIVVAVFVAVYGDLDPWVGGGILLAFALGLADDRFGLSPFVRLGGEVVVGSLVWLSSSTPAGVGGWLLCVLVVVGMINAVNLYDGLDGLSGLAAAISGLGLWAMGGGSVALALTAALFGFLISNWHPAKLFLGDNGAYAVGTTIAAVALSFHGLQILVGATLAGVFAVDLVITLVRRRLSGAPLFQGDRSHAYDQMVDRGWSVRRTAATSGLIQLVFVSAVVATLQGAGAVAALAVAGIATSVALLAAHRQGLITTGVGGVTA